MSLLEFTKRSWMEIEPGRPLKVGFHMEALAEHLEAVTHGQIKRLIINVPPRSSKSTVGSVNWQPWEWAQKTKEHDCVKSTDNEKTGK